MEGTRPWSPLPCSGALAHKGPSRRKICPFPFQTDSYLRTGKCFETGLGSLRSNKYIFRPTYDSLRHGNRLNMISAKPRSISDPA